jgi:hypothetical protein
MTETLPGDKPFIDRSAQDGNKFRHSVDFIDDDELGGLSPQLGLGVLLVTAVEVSSRLRYTAPWGQWAARGRAKVVYPNCGKEGHSQYAAFVPLRNDSGYF